MNIKSKLKDMRLKINKIGSKTRKNKLKIQNPTIVSNNCWGGIIYQYLGTKYCSPTIGMYFFAEEYIKFLKRFDYYLTIPMKIINAKESRYYEQMIKKNHQNALVGVLDDVEIVFLHYNEPKKIIDNLEKRKSRINYDCIIYI